MLGNPSTLSCNFKTIKAGGNSFYIMDISLGKDNKFYLYAPTNNIKDLDYLRVTDNQIGLIKSDLQVYFYDIKNNKLTTQR